MAVSTPGYVFSGTPGAREHAAEDAARRISPIAGRALEKLGHAIDYLSDEYAHRSPSMNPADPEVKAIQILMALNREIYFACPVVPTWTARLRSLLHLGRGSTGRS